MNKDKQSGHDKHTKTPDQKSGNQEKPQTEDPRKTKEKTEDKQKVAAPNKK